MNVLHSNVKYSTTKRPITSALDKLFMLFMSHMSGATDPTNLGSNLVVCCCTVAFQTTNLVYNQVEGWETMCELGDVFAANTVPDPTITATPTEES